MVIRVAAVDGDARVLGHELDHLQHAGRAGDVRDRNRRLERLRLRRPLGVREDATVTSGSFGSCATVRASATR